MYIVNQSIGIGRGITFTLLICIGSERNQGSARQRSSRMHAMGSLARKEKKNGSIGGIETFRRVEATHECSQAHEPERHESL